MFERAIQRLDALPRLGWVDGPSPVESLAAVAGEMGLDALWVKRDDALGLAHGLHGGTKVRKLDVLLASPPWRDAPVWASVGAIGSGHLVALSTAARLLKRRLRAHLFWEPPLPDLLQNLAYVASGPGELRFSGSRVGLSLRDPRVLLSERIGDAAVVPPGASCLLGQAGIVLGALELKRQIDEGLCPAPAHVFVPLGSGGTLVGLLVGFALAGVPCTLHGVAVVERIFTTEHGVRARALRLLAFLGAEGATLPTLRLHRDQLGRGYGLTTTASLAACARLSREGIGLEPVYSGKTMAGLRAAAPGLRGPVLFWLTPRTPGPLPVAPDWRERLPRALQRRLEAAEHPRGPTRRRVLLGAAGLVAGVAVVRTTGYPSAPAGLAFVGRGEAALLRAALEVVIYPEPTREAITDTLRRIDRFLSTQPTFIRWQVRGALSLVEQGPLALLGRWARFSELGRTERLASLDALADRGGVAAEAGRCVRDLAMVGHYQRPEAWPRLGYRGPWVGREARADAYAAFRSDAPPPGFEAAS